MILMWHFFLGPLDSQLMLLVFLDCRLACSYLPPIIVPWNSFMVKSELVVTLFTPTGPMVEPASEVVPSFWTLIVGGTYQTSYIFWLLLTRYCLLSSLTLRFSAEGIAFHMSEGKWYDTWISIILPFVPFTHLASGCPLLLPCPCPLPLPHLL